MAYIFYRAILKAVALGQVMPPSTEFEVADPVCDKFSGSGLNPGGRTQRGTGNDDEVYRHYSEEMGVSDANMSTPWNCFQANNSRSSGQRPRVNGIVTSGDSLDSSQTSTMTSLHGSKRVTPQTPLQFG